MSSLTRQRQHICLPELTKEEFEEVAAGRQVRKQERHGKQGWGFSVEDVDAPPSLVMDVLGNFGDYANVIPVVRQADVVSRRVSAEGVEQVRCNYRVSRFWLSVSVFQTALPEDGLVHFELDPSVAGCVLQEAAGFWHVAPAPGGSGSRVWLCVGLRAHGWLPTQLVDYAAERALRRATAWLKPHMQRALRDGRRGSSATPPRARGPEAAAAAAHPAPLRALRAA
ncbi:unnamed protein product [Prorocentrum cordatum]|uniref:Coenzyme Q-binding protein COQ10 START domain-containing protein n=1 Tax=Prorocentrum cordatum TaxID=2364126 RepID=A0ABN9UII2_9DINO|nr:unnamed protein product [Polarella glacialis]